MDRRRFLSSLLTIPIFGSKIIQQRLENVIHIKRYGGETDIFIPNYNNQLKFIQITDSHIDIVDECEKDKMKYANRMHKAYESSRRSIYLPEKMEKPIDYFLEALKKAKLKKVDLILLTGDIINFPSLVSVKFVIKKLQQTGIPWLYTSGNHDWHYEGMKGSSNYLRKTWIENSLSPFYHEFKYSPLYYSKKIKGINFVCIDNSTYQVNREQLNFLKNQLRNDEPVIIVSHIPYFFKGIDNIVCGSPKWKAKNDKNYIIERREIWPKKGNNQSTMEFIKTIHNASDKIIAIITGHLHKSNLSFTENLCQYISFATANGVAEVFNVKGK